MSELVVKDNALINASYNLDLVEQRLILLAIIEARQSGKGINANDPLTVHAESYINQFHVHRNTAYQALKDACNDLFARQFSYQELSAKGNIINKRSRWVSEVGYVDKEAVVQLIFAPAIVPFITRLEQRFTQYEIQQISELSTGYAIRLYELLIAWRSTGKTPLIELNDFRHKMGVIESKYTAMCDLKKRVLDPAIKQVNEHTDITVKCEQHKRGRSIIGFSFSFKQKDKTQIKPQERVIKAKDEHTIDLFSDMTEKQLNFFSSKLSELAEMQAMAEPGEEMPDFIKRIKGMLQDPVKQKKLQPYLKQVGFSSY